VNVCALSGLILTCIMLHIANAFAVHRFRQICFVLLLSYCQLLYCAISIVTNIVMVVVVCSDCGNVSTPVNWTKGRMLGRGTFGQVFLCHDRDTGRDLAVKEVSVFCLLDEESEVQQP